MSYRTSRAYERQLTPLDWEREVWRLNGELKQRGQVLRRVGDVGQEINASREPAYPVIVVQTLGGSVSYKTHMKDCSALAEIGAKCSCGYAEKFTDGLHNLSCPAIYSSDAPCTCGRAAP